MEEDSDGSTQDGLIIQARIPEWEVCLIFSACYIMLCYVKLGLKTFKPGLEEEWCGRKPRLKDRSGKEDWYLKYFKKEHNRTDQLRA